MRLVEPLPSYSVPADDSVAHGMYALAERLYPICRSITGDGLRETLRILREQIPLELRETPTGTPVLDWQVPPEWNIRDAWIKDPAGRTIVDFKHHNLHVMSYSVPVHRRLSLAELTEHLYSIPDHPDWIPYRTSYYNENWGFCLSHRQLQRLEEGLYEVCIDSTLADGSLTYGELCLPGEMEAEILISTHCCHPSLANDNLSGIVLATFLARQLLNVPRRHTFRFLFIPGTIGAITWLALNQSRVSRIRHGLVAACVGDPGPFNYKRSRRGNALVDQAAEHVLRHSGLPYAIHDFTPFGYDTRQYCSPGFNLPVGSLMRTMHERYPQYHTSADDLDFIQPEALEQSLAIYARIVEVLERDRRLRNTHPQGEPQLGRRGLYRLLGGQQDGTDRDTEAMLWILNLADGENSLLDIAERSGLPFMLIDKVSRLLHAQNLLRTVDHSRPAG